MSTDQENWQNRSDENQDSAQEGNRPERPYYSRNSEEHPAGRGDRPQRPRFSRPAPTTGERVHYNREERPSFRREGGEQRPYRPYNREGGNEQRPYRPYRPNYNREEGGEQRPYRPQRPNYNREGGDEQRPYRPYRPGYNREGGSEQRPYRPQRPNYNREGGDEQRPYFRRPSNGYGSDQNGERPRFNSYDSNRRPQGGGFRPRRSGDYDPNAKYSRKKQLEYKDTLTDPNEPIRLNKFLSNSGICSRREADEFIAAGLVTVNGTVVKELGTKVKRSDTVMYRDSQITPERKVYVLLNKPKDCVTTAEDPQERKTVMDCIKGACRERIYPVGRLDRNTTGVLLLTNDGDLASKLTHPKFLKKKIYQVRCDRNIAQEDMEKIATGITLEDGEIHADEISYISEDKSEAGIEIHSGKNRIVRRIFESLGYRITRLDRVFFAGLTKKNLRRGQWRYLTEKEVNMLRMGAFE